MRTIVIVISVLALMMGIYSCNSRQKNEAEQPSELLLPDEYVENGKVEMQASHVTDTAMWKGKIYTYDITREPDTLLPKVIDEDTGKPFADNHIDLNIKVNGKQIFNQRFYKKSFAKCLDESFRKNGVLEGLVFDKTCDEGLCFAVSVAFPQSDMYIPMTFTIDGHGKMSEVERDKNLDAEIIPPYDSDGDGV